MPLVSDLYEPTLAPIFNLKPAFMFADGIFSPLERVMHEHKTMFEKKFNDIYYITGSRSRELYIDFLGDQFAQNIEVKDHHSENRPLKPAELLYAMPGKLSKDVEWLSREKYYKEPASKFLLEGSNSDLWISPGAEISAYSCLDAREGPIIIEEGVKIGPFSHLKGPLFIDRNSYINQGNVSGSRIGKECRIGGEVAYSMIGNFSNKVHSGFLGHSIIGEWVNLGALTTTSNLKNNYGFIRLKYQKKEYETRVQKFGSIIGDFAKLAIGSMLNTGTIIDTAAALHHERPIQKYYPPFFWGGKSNIYRWELFMRDIEIIMKRRNQKISNIMISLLEKIYPEKGALKNQD